MLTIQEAEQAYRDDARLMLDDYEGWIEALLAPGSLVTPQFQSDIEICTGWWAVVYLCREDTPRIVPITALSFKEVDHVAQKLPDRVVRHSGEHPPANNLRPGLRYGDEGPNYSVGDSIAVPNSDALCAGEIGGRSPVARDGDAG